jgi:hypothetical protein
LLQRSNIVSSCRPTSVARAGFEASAALGSADAMAELQRFAKQRGDAKAVAGWQQKAVEAKHLPSMRA